MAAVVLQRCAPRVGLCLLPPRRLGSGRRRCCACAERPSTWQPSRRRGRRRRRPVSARRHTLRDGSHAAIALHQCRRKEALMMHTRPPRPMRLLLQRQRGQEGAVVQRAAEVRAPSPRPLAHLVQLRLSLLPCTRSCVGSLATGADQAAAGRAAAPSTTPPCRSTSTRPTHQRERTKQQQATRKHCSTRSSRCERN